MPDNVLKETNFTNLGDKKIGKVRDIYLQPDKLIFVSTDRHSSFDRLIAHIPYKGNVLNRTSAFWFKETEDIVPNHVVAIPDPNVTVGKKCEVIPVEVVLRGFITGTTNTSLWTLYKNGQRDFGNFSLPDGMKKNQKLDEPVVTPTTKSDEHDRPITPKEIIESEIVNKELWEQIEDAAMRLFKRGQEVALAHGLILVDTKYEFGLDREGKLTLIDEIHTPDSSRYWQAGTFEARLAAGEEPEFFDKEFLRLWFKEHCDPYNDAVLPEAPAELIAELSRRYIQIYEQLTGEKFAVDDSTPILERIERNLEQYVIQ
ncbi:phosphoribosylaminoimidazolesuccinocarboxamide synthase [Candidatus Wolfebacteria bacterium]|nr:phosphoribosylaminoimidazolesuccinocarboxamide synthase [Candidatus Wolfebacteria bacterium]